jgi:BASS family bile acid:Na+ symporter
VNIRHLAKWIENNFLILALVFSAGALGRPGAFVWMKPHIATMLGVVMFGMGLTLEFSDFRQVWEKKRLVAAGVFLQFLIMPVLAVIIALVFHLPKEAFIGLVIVGACPGGTASNVVTYIAKANLPLSVVLTMTSTLLAPLLTPALIYFLAGTRVEVAFLALVKEVFWIVLFPLLDGLVLRRYLRKQLAPFIEMFPSISILAIVLIIACIMGLNKATILAFPVLVIVAVMLHNGLGLVLGYLSGKLFRMNEADCRTVAIEVGMQNSGLGAALAAKFFTPAAALPSALFSLWHNLSGITIAKYWSRRLPSEISK